MTPTHLLCLKSASLQLPHLLKLNKCQELPVHTLVQSLGGTFLAGTEYHIPTVNPRFWWVQEFGVN